MAQHKLPARRKPSGSFVSQRCSPSSFWRRPLSDPLPTARACWLTGVGDVAKSWRLRDGGLAAFAKMNINIDAYAKEVAHFGSWRLLGALSKRPPAARPPQRHF
jgi:hypothetical protein